MRAMIFEKPGFPLQLKMVSKPVPVRHEVLLRVLACGVCRTDLHIIDGELTGPKLPLIPGHQIIGVVESMGTEAKRYEIGDIVGVPWLGYTCGTCNFCRKGQENLCENELFTGYTKDGGFAEYAVADERFCFPVPEGFSVTQAAPLLCSGMIGYRALMFTGNSTRIGFYGFGSAAHILCQVAVYLGRQVYAFTRKGDDTGQAFARSLGAVWAGSSDDLPPQPLESAIIFAPAGELMVTALKAVIPGGTVISAGIHMTDIPSFPYSLLWGERSLRSVANLTRQDGESFLALAPKVPVKIAVEEYPLEKLNEAIEDLRKGRLSGSAVVKMQA